MATNKSAIIRVEHLTASYEENVVLDDVSLEIHRGEVFAILGASGCGKSTLLKHMIGLYQPASGKVFIDGEDIADVLLHKGPAILKKIGVMYQRGALFGSMTILENVRLPLDEFTDLPPEARNLIALMKLNLVGLNGFSQRMPAELSGGMQKRAAIARAMALDPKILFLDELSAGLDPITSAELDQLVLSLVRSLNITFIIVTHELPSIYTIADRVIMLDKETKGVVATGKPEELRDLSNNPWVRQFFNRDVGFKMAD